MPIFGRRSTRTAPVTLQDIDTDSPCFIVLELAVKDEICGATGVNPGCGVGVGVGVAVGVGGAGVNVSEDWDGVNLGVGVGESAYSILMHPVTEINANSVAIQVKIKYFFDRFTMGFPFKIATN